MRTGGVLGNVQLWAWNLSLDPYFRKRISVSGWQGWFSFCSPTTVAIFDDLCPATVAARGDLYLATMVGTKLVSVGARGVRSTSQFA